jgi:hypothetical protein
MGSDKAPSPASDDSELQDGYFPDSKGARSDAARLRETKRKILRGDIGISAGLPAGVAPNMIFPVLPSPIKPRATLSSHCAPTLVERVNSVKQALELNGFTLSSFTRTTCAYDYPDQQLKHNPSFEASPDDLREAEAVRIWAKEIACQELLREAKRMEAQGSLYTRGNYSFILSAQDFL